MKVFEIVSFVVVAIASLWIAYGFFFESNIETPSFERIKKTSNYEIRHYRLIHIAQTSTQSENASFRTLFQFIDGKNSLNQKIPMTAPVIMDANTMMFVLPELTNIPVPNSSDISITTLTNIKVAVIGFSGSASNAEDYKQKLNLYLKQDGILTTDSWYLSQYNSPFVFPLFRKNEIWIELANK